MNRCKRVSRKTLLRLIVVLLVYAVALRLHVFRKYHTVKPFHHVLASNVAPTSTGRKDAAGRGDEQADWRGTEVVYPRDDGIVVNLDSGKWYDVDLNVTNTREILAAVNRSHRAVLRCGNDVTSTTTYQPIRRLFDGGDVLVVGDFQSNVTKYAVFGVGLENANSTKTISYLFYAPLTALAWRRIGYGTILIVVDELDGWLAKPLYRHVMKYACNVHAVTIFLPSAPEHVVTVSQVSRLFSAVAVRRLLTDQGTPAEYDPYIVTSDVDLWPLKEDMFEAEVPSDRLSSPEICVLNNGCCAWFVHRSVRQKSYPAFYVRARTSTWLRLVGFSDGVRRDAELTSGVIVDELRHQFGPLPDGPIRKGPNDGWLMDQHLVSYWINRYAETQGHDRVAFGNRTGMRLEPAQWPERVSSTTLEFTFDVHLIKLKSKSNWFRILSVLLLMYGENTDEYKWCTGYKDKFVSLLPRHLREEIEN